MTRASVAAATLRLRGSREVLRVSRQRLLRSWPAAASVEPRAGGEGRHAGRHSSWRTARQAARAVRPNRQSKATSRRTPASGAFSTRRQRKRARGGYAAQWRDLDGAVVSLFAGRRSDQREATNESGHAPCSLASTWSRTTYCTGVAEPPRCATKSRDGAKITTANWRSSVSRRVGGSGSSASSRWCVRQSA